MYAKTMLDDTRGRYCSDVFGLYVNLRQISHVRGTRASTSHAKVGGDPPSASSQTRGRASHWHCYTLCVIQSSRPVVILTTFAKPHVRFQTCRIALSAWEVMVSLS